MGCCPSSPAEEGRQPLLAPPPAHHQHTAAEPYPPPLSYQSSSGGGVVDPSTASSSSSSFSSSSAHHRHEGRSAKHAEAEPSDRATVEDAPASENEGPDTTPAPAPADLAASGLRVIDAPRPEGATENMTKEEEFEFYRKKMEQLNREKEDTNARFLQEEREKQKQLEQKQHKKPSLRNFFKGEEEEAEVTIGAPQGFKHEAHIGWTPEGGFDIFNIPNEWKKLMSKAGVTEEQMQDKETAMFIVSFVASTLGSQQQGGQAVVQDLPTPISRVEAVVSPKETTEGKAEDTTEGKAHDGGDEHAVPSAPPAPAPPSPTHQHSGDATAPPPPPALTPSVANEGSSGDMFSAIRGGVSLKKVEALPDVKNLSVQEEDSIAGALARALQSRRFAMTEEEDEPDEEDNGEWDD